MGNNRMTEPRVNDRNNTYSPLIATFYCSSTGILGNSALGKDGRKGGQMIRAKARKTSRTQKFLS